MKTNEEASDTHTAFWFGLPAASVGNIGWHFRPKECISDMLSDFRIRREERVVFIDCLLSSLGISDLSNLLEVDI